MHISHEPGDGSFSVVLELHDPIPLEWARCACAEIHRRIDGGRIVLVKRLGEVMAL